MTMIKNAIIESCDICDVYNGVLGIRMELNGDCWGVGYCGGYALGSIVNRQGSEAFGKAVATILDVFCKSAWSELPGTAVRVELDDDGRCVKVGHFMRDDWFSIEDTIAAAVGRRDEEGL